MNHPSNYRNRRVVVLGLAKSGVSVAKLFHKYGAQVVVNDKKTRDKSPEAGELEALGITVICGFHPDDLVNNDTALLVKNPGIPYGAPPVKAALEQGVEIVTEVEAAWWISPAPMIGITGSNGKTTTTTLIGELLSSAGLKPIVAGNIGLPMCDAVQDTASNNWIVAELSSFQLKGTSSFRPRIGLLLNLTETHLDYHGDMADYVASKAKLFANQTAEDTAVLNWDDAVCRSLASELNAQVVPFSLYERLEAGAFVDPPFARESELAGSVSTSAHAGEPTGEPRRMIVYRTAGSDSGNDSDDGNEPTRTIIMPVDEMSIPERHNVANALAAIAAAVAAGADPGSLAATLRSFKAVEHRLEYVCEKNGVRYYNDSKATNPTATTSAVRSLDAPIILVAGGLDRGSDYMELLPTLKQGRVKGLVALGETREKLAHVAKLAGLTKVETVEPEEDAERTLDQAVKRAAAMAEQGDIVLLSPACASWDMFASYEQRGSMFKQSAHTL